MSFDSGFEHDFNSEIAGEAEATVAIANAKATALQKVGETLKATGDSAAALSVAEQYVKAFSELAKTNNTLILPADTANVSATVAQVRTHSIISDISNNLNPCRRFKFTRQFHRTENRSGIVKKCENRNPNKEVLV